MRARPGTAPGPRAGARAASFAPPREPNRGVHALGRRLSRRGDGARGGFRGVARASRDGETTRDGRGHGRAEGFGVVRPPRREHQHVPRAQDSLPRAGWRRLLRRRPHPRPFRPRGGGVFEIYAVRVQAHARSSPERMPVWVEVRASEHSGGIQEHSFHAVHLREDGDARVVVQRGHRARGAEPHPGRLRLRPTRGVHRTPRFHQRLPPRRIRRGVRRAGGIRNVSAREARLARERVRECGLHVHPSLARDVSHHPPGGFAEGHGGRRGWRFERAALDGGVRRLYVLKRVGG